MKKYEEIFNIIYSYLYETDEVEFTNEVISAHDLYSIVNEKFHELRKIKRTSLRKCINKDYSFLKEISSIFKRESNSLNTKCRDVVIAGDDKESKITFVFNRFASKKPKSISLLKNRKSGEIYYDEEVVVTKRNKDLANNNFSEIIKTFKTIEKLVDFSKNSLKSSEDENVVQEFSDFIFDGCLTYDAYGSVNVSLKVGDEMEAYYFEESRKKLNQVIETNKEELLKKIPININSLNNTCRMLVKEKMETNNDKSITKEKQFMKALRK